ncbi:MAG: hypothetical protein V4553_11270, partial [Bacteroidota bacterium]
FPACGREGGPAKRRPGESTRTGRRPPALGMGMDTGPAPKACRRMNVQPEPQATPKQSAFTRPTM